MTFELDTVHHADIFDLCERVYRAGVLVDMILCDLPYGTTQCAWDTVIPFEPMWKWFKRIVKPNGAIVLTASQPFTSALVMSNPKMFRYEWIWVKSQGSNFLDVNRKPMKNHESVLVFGSSPPSYFPQMEHGSAYRTTTNSKTKAYGKLRMVETVNTGTRFPKTVLHFSTESDRGMHTTQKPVALFDYLIRTYTQIGDIVFDPCVGSGTTAIAARNCGRHYIVGDITEEYVEVVRKRLAEPFTPPLFVT